MRLSFTCTLASVAISFAVFLPFHHADGCTRIFWNSNYKKVMLAARNMDLMANDRPTIYVMPAGIKRTGGEYLRNPAQWTSKYGSVLTALIIPQDPPIVAYDEGINTQGLAFHYLYLQVSDYEPRDSRPGVDGKIYGQYLLDNAATVKEALELMEQTQLVFAPGDPLKELFPCHLALEDATGDSAVVEFIAGIMVVYHGKDLDDQDSSVVLTNDPPLDQQLVNRKQYREFGGNLPWPGDVDSKSRFVRASAFLLTLHPFPNPHVDYISRLFSAIRAEATPFDAKEFDRGEANAWPTLWTSLFDLTNKMIYFSHNIARNYFWIDMGKLRFSPGAPVMHLQADSTGLFGDVSKLLIPPAHPALPLLLLN